MKHIEIVDKDKWKEFILREAKYNFPIECNGGLCVDAGCNIGDLPINFGNRFNKWVCFDVFDENIKEARNNTKDLGLDIEILKYAVWDVADNWIPVMAYEPWDSKSLNHFGNSGNVGCLEFIGEKGEGWKEENTIGLAPTINLERIIKTWGDINLLKVDVEGSEYKFLLGKDLSRVNWLLVELHAGQQDELIEWIRCGPPCR